LLSRYRLSFSHETVQKALTSKLVKTTLLGLGEPFMNKDEILKKSRELKEDEGTIYTDNKGRRYGVIAFSSIFIIITFFNLFTSQNNFVPYCMFFAYMSAEAYGKYRATKSKTFMTTTVLASFASFAFLICYIFVVLGIGT
jgi:hypothetical protein